MDTSTLSASLLDETFLQPRQRKIGLERNTVALFTIEFNKFLMKRFNYKSPPAHFRDLGETATIDASRKAFDFYLRLGSNDRKMWPENTLIIARIGFNQARVGHGSAFILFLLDHAKQFNFKHIGIEQVNDESSAFGEAIGMKRIRESRNYASSVSHIKATLALSE